jgi:hypothetical protein
MNDLEARIAALESQSPGVCREQWAKLTGRSVPKVSPAMLRLALAWEMQARELGGLPRKLSMKLDQLGRGTAPARAGMRLVREWGGKAHIVTVGEDETVLWEGRAYRSLSEVARAITGSRWSGPAFFGLRHRREAA